MDFFIRSNPCFNLQAKVLPIRALCSASSRYLSLLLVGVLFLQMAETEKQKEAEINFTKEEFEVAEVLIQIQHLFLHSNVHELCWGCRKKRSSVSGEKTHIKSPVTPLSFSASDSNSKSKHSRRRTLKKKKKKTHKELKEIIAGLHVLQEQLKHEVSKVKDYYEKLRAVNLQLKAQQLELELSHKGDQFDLNSCETLNVFEGQTEKLCPVFEEKHDSVIHQSSKPSTGEKNNLIIHEPSTPSTKEMEAPILNQPWEPIVIGNFRYQCAEMPLFLEFDLSLKSNHHPCFDIKSSIADETASKDFYCKAALAAQARKRRIEINRVKNSMTLKQPHFR